MLPTAHDDEHGNGRRRIGGAGRGRPERWSLLLQPELGQLAVARDVVDDVADVAGADPRTRFLLKLAVNEAVANARQHGSRFEAPVRLTASLEDDRVCFAAADPGPTFRIAADVPPDLNDRGRGLLLMVKCVDALTQHRLPRGKEVRLVKRLH